MFYVEQVSDNIIFNERSLEILDSKYYVLKKIHAKNAKLQSFVI